MEYQNKIVVQGFLHQKSALSEYNGAKKIDFLVRQESTYNGTTKVTILPFTAWRDASKVVNDLKTDDPVRISGKLNSFKSDRTGTIRYFATALAQEVSKISKDEDPEIDMSNIPF